MDVLQGSASVSLSKCFRKKEEPVMNIEVLVSCTVQRIFVSAKTHNNIS